MDYEVKMKKRTETGGVKHNLYVRLCPYRINSDHDEARKSMKKNNEKKYEIYVHEVRSFIIWQPLIEGSLSPSVYASFSSELYSPPSSLALVAYSTTVIEQVGVDQTSCIFLSFVFPSEPVYYILPTFVENSDGLCGTPCRL
jgi:hypothetical protein